MMPVIDLLVFATSTIIVFVMLLLAHYLYQRKIRRGLNGIYTSMIFSAIWAALDSLLSFEFYFLDSLDLYDGQNPVGFLVKLYRFLLGVYFILNLISWYLSVTTPEKQR